MEKTHAESGQPVRKPAGRWRRGAVHDLGGVRGARIERIVSTGQARPRGFWCDQEQAEWVVLLSGSAVLMIEGEEMPRILRPGD